MSWAREFGPARVKKQLEQPELQFRNGTGLPQTYSDFGIPLERDFAQTRETGLTPPSEFGYAAFPKISQDTFTQLSPEAVLFPQVYEETTDRLRSDETLLVTGIVEDQLGATVLHTEFIW